jgi:N-acetylneuraminic acid mutarotase
VQVSSDSTFTIVNVEDSALISASKTIDSLSRGVKYFWRVRAKNAGGVSNWTTPWNFTTVPPSIPSVPSLVSPLNGAVNQSRRPTLAWSAVAGAASYHVQVSGNPGFTAVVAVDSSLTDTSKTLDSLLAGGAVYFWRVRTKNAAGVSAWTSAWSFTITTTTGPWIARADLPAAIIYMGVAVVNNKIYAFGGYDGSSYTNGVYLYDPAGDTWTTYGTMAAARAPAAAAVNGRIYVIGGGDIGTVEEYDPVTRTFTPKASMPTVRGPAVAVVDSSIYAIGGYNSISGSLGTNESYDPSRDTWTPLADMTARNSTPVAAANGKVYAIGGEYWPNTPLDLVEEYDPSGNAWVTKTALPSPRTRAAAATVNGKIYVIGGTNDVIDLAEVELYDPSTDKWTAKTAMPTARSGAGIAVVNGKIYVIGGSSSSNPRLTTVEEYDPLLDP